MDPDTYKVTEFEACQPGEATVYHRWEHLRPTGYDFVLTSREHDVECIGGLEAHIYANEEPGLYLMEAPDGNYWLDMRGRS